MIDAFLQPAAFLALAFGYLAGSIPFGLLITKLAGLGDIRQIGSGNIGTTNVLRTGRKDLAAATLLADALKGTVAVLVARHFLGEPAALAAGLGAFVGHLFPVWLGFKGGKGVATYLGLLLAFDWRAAVAFAVVWVGVAYAKRYSSLAALTATVASPAVLFGLGRTETGVLFVILSVIVWAKHHENIQRLLAGTESKIGQKAKPAAAGPG